MSSNRDYILQKYLSPGTADETKKKKKKPKSSKSIIRQANLCIVDEDDLGGWPTQGSHKPTTTDLDVPAPKKPTFKNSSESGWQTIREAELPVEEDELPVIVPGEYTEADLRASLKSKSPQEDGPMAASTQQDLTERKRRSVTPPPSTKRRISPSPEIPSISDGPKMSNGASVGLQSAESLKADLDRRQLEIHKAFNQMDPSVSGQHAETVYRDKSGKKISLSAQRAELANQRRKEEEEQAKLMEWGKGLVQRQEAIVKRNQEEMEKNKPLARYKDDVELNEELRSKDRWNDPAAGFLTKSKKSKTKWPVYQGPPAPPNRFGIPPGYRWDGVDRSNGFEKEFFQRKYSKNSMAEEAYKWSTEDM
ncbi:hypothetical protein K493DRAFT_279626 [Basidiobolus meristosporus CBS 931.73]|uniref:Pre-mRNA-splicing factor CWC26 n=1 Tax=Basidiobolus meristosporus CBS 931.73 TaxID=1314790 RepID=A0A1Y1YNB0_9FUNG|nr:hypothetical protein K493DRAFT_279626 [Basidiobolus meristosporus CBS 931.73]|eukprot:ORX99468.1 hypothetical protein K493DRAFT_279626 [Basidiobolus meristosporus CBS 931.73]